MVTLLWWLAGNALVVAALIPVVWLLCRLLRYRPGAQHLLWFLLFLKLITPPLINWPWPAQFLAWLRPQEQVANAPADVPVSFRHVGVPNVAGVVEPAVEPSVEPSEPIALPISPIPPAAIDDVPPALEFEQIAVAVWIAGGVLLAAYTVVALRRQRSLLRASAHAPRPLVAAIAHVASKLGLRPPRAALSEHISSPLVCCVGRPRLLWPAMMSEPDVVARCDGVIAHELAHLARRDHYLVYAELLVSVCCWWNPLMWLIRRWLRETRELACDAIAIAAVREPRPDYAQRILSLSVSRFDSLSFAPAFGAGSSSRRFLKRRLTMVFDDRVSGRVSLSGLALAVFLAAVALPGFLLGDPMADAQGVSTSSASAAGEPGSASSATTESESESTVDGVTKRKYSRATSLKRLIKNDEITGEKSAEISLDGGGILRISKNEQGDLIVTVEQTVTSSDSRPIKSRAGSVIVGTGDTIALDAGSETGTTSARTVGKRAGTGTGGASSFIRSLRQTEPVSSSADTAASEFDRRLLASDVELAEVSFMEKRAELEIAKKDNVDEPRLRLAELAVRRAEIELKRAKLRLSQGSRAASKQ